jgi:hypothetical protein
MLLDSKESVCMPSDRTEPFRNQPWPKSFGDSLIVRLVHHGAVHRTQYPAEINYGYLQMDRRRAGVIGTSLRHAPLKTSLAHVNADFESVAT